MMAKLPRALSPVREVAGPVPRAERDRIARNAAVQRAVRVLPPSRVRALAAAAPAFIARLTRL